jgi:excisionase family DNA binding protein
MDNTDATSEPLPRLLTVREVAEMLRVSRPTAYRWCRTGQVPTLHIGGTLRVPARALVKTLEAGKSGFRP